MGDRAKSRRAPLCYATSPPRRDFTIPGGAAVGPNPTDKGKPGSKHHLLVERQGIPLAVAVTTANVHDSQMLVPMLDAVVPIRTGRRGRPRRRPEKLDADKGYDYRRCPSSAGTISSGCETASQTSARRPLAGAPQREMYCECGAEAWR